MPLGTCVFGKILVHSNMVSPMKKHKMEVDS